MNFIWYQKERHREGGHVVQNTETWSAACVTIFLNDRSLEHLQARRSDCAMTCSGSIQAVAQQRLVLKTDSGLPSVVIIELQVWSTETELFSFLCPPQVFKIYLRKCSGFINGIDRITLYP